ncbi:hypothetical protein HYV11_03160 [Candidatus Dependentiae bacterium]|nr:hypothetical protein [Candidatus Dependentiae bacterium]
MNKKIWLIIISSIELVSILVAENCTNIGTFLLASSECHGVKTFINDSSKPLVIQWRLKALDFDEPSYIQTPLVMPESFCEIDVDRAVQFIQSKTNKKLKNFILDLGIGIITKKPIRPRTQFDYRALKKLEKGLFLTKNEWLKNSTFRLYRNKNNRFFCDGFVK